MISPLSAFGILRRSYFDAIPPAKPSRLSACVPSGAAALVKVAFFRKDSAGSSMSTPSEVPSLVSDDSDPQSIRALASLIARWSPVPAVYVVTSPILSQCSAFPYTRDRARGPRVPNNTKVSDISIAVKSLASPGSLVRRAGSHFQVTTSTHLLKSVAGYIGTLDPVPRVFPGPSVLVQIDSTGIPITYVVDPDATPLGTGGCSSVYLATTHDLMNASPELCVLKVSPKVHRQCLALDLESEILCEACADGDAMPFVAHGGELFESFESDHVYIPMKYYSGGCLRAHVGARRPIDRVAFLWMIQLLMGLQWMHDRSYVHCDLKSENVVIDERGRVVLCDFGLSRSLHWTRHLSAEGFQETPFPFPGGTPSYHAPEAHFDDSRTFDVTPAIDIYGLALLWVDIWGGEQAIMELDAAAEAGYFEHSSTVVRVVQRCIPPKFGTVDLSPLKAIIIRMLSFNPIQRPTVEEIMNGPFFGELDLDEILEAQIAPRLLT